MTEGDEKEEILHRTMAVATSTCIGTPRPHRHPCNPARPARNKAGRRTAVDANQQGIHQETGGRHEVPGSCVNFNGGRSDAPGKGKKEVAQCEWRL